MQHKLCWGKAQQRRICSFALYSFECMAWIMKFMLSIGKEILLGELEGLMLLLPHSFHLKGSEYQEQQLEWSATWCGQYSELLLLEVVLAHPILEESC
jgi:hypothetical protein